MRFRRGRHVRIFLQHAWALAVAGVFAVPVLWMVSMSFKTAGEIYTTPPPLLPHVWTLSNYHLAIAAGLGRMFLNSAIVAVSATIIAVCAGLLTAYALSHFVFGGRKAILIAMVLTQMVPVAVLIIPLYQIFGSLNLLDTYGSVVIAYLTFDIPVAVWFVRSFFRTIPADIEEAARVDGCTSFQSFVRVSLPLIAPGLLATAMYVFVISWQELMFALTFLTSNPMHTLTVGVIGFIGQHGTNYGAVMAAATLMTLPPVVLFFLAQRRFIAGFVSAGGIK